MKHQYGGLAGLFVLILLILFAIIASLFAANSNKDKVDVSHSDQEQITPGTIFYPPATLEPSPGETESGQAPTEPYTWAPLSHTDEYVSGGQTLIFSFVNQPFFSGGIPEITERINQYLSKYCQDNVYIITEMKILADEDCTRANNTGTPFMPYEFATDYRSVHIHGNILSILFSSSRSMGISGAKISYTSLTFDLRTGQIITLSGILGMSDEEAKDYANTIISQMIANDPATYYPNVETELLSIINLKDFYLDGSGLTLYFNSDILSPNVYGIRTFLIPYDKLGV